MHSEAGESASRLGVKSDGQFVFTCSSCGGVAATLAITNDDQPVDGGPMPDGTRYTWQPGVPAYRLEFVGVNTGKVSEDLAELVAGLEVLDPLVVRRFDWRYG